MPRSIDAMTFLAEADDSVPLRELAEQQHYGQQMTMIPAFIGGNDLQLLSAACRELFGDEADLVANELAQGYDNDTIAADQELWELGRTAQQRPQVMSALRAEATAATMSDLRSAGREPEFFSALDAFLGRFGARAESWDIACPTWNEQRDGFWAQLRGMATPAAPEPMVALRRAAERRMALASEIAGKLAGEPDKQARFRRRYDRIAPYIGVREERARWQLGLTGALRGALLRRGARLAQRGVIDAADDVLYLSPDELDAGTGDLRGAVARRRAEHEHWKKRTPPMVIGGSAAPREPTAEAVLPADHVIHGIGGSRGTATGRARVIVDLADADRFEPGDVLVCVMTSPPWTPLFALAVAVVVDTGEMNAHAAIAAREYGIPCVLATQSATRVIPDGATVTVDGVNGTVRVTEGAVGGR
jgi:pyruvate,water dikinase